jgi:hypothetical protein
MKFVENDDPKLAQQRIALQPRRENPFGGHEESRTFGEALLESDLPSDFVSDAPSALLGDPSRECARRDAPRLQQDRLADLHQRGWDACGLPRSRWGDDHCGAVCPYVRCDLSDVGIDRERRLH